MTDKLMLYWVRKVVFSNDGKAAILASDWLKHHTNFTNENRSNDYRNIILTAEFSCNGKLIVTICIDNTLRVWSSELHKTILILQENEYRFETATFSLDCQKILTQSSYGEARVWDAKTGRLITSEKKGLLRTDSAQFDRTGELIVTTMGGEITLWEVETGTIVFVWEHADESFRVAAIDRIGQLIAGGCDSGSVYIKDITNDVEILHLRGHTNCVNSIAFSPDGKWIVTVSDDRTVRLWNTLNGCEVRCFERNFDVCISAQFSNDGKWIVMEDDEGGIEVVLTSIDDLLSIAQSLNQRDPPDFTVEEYGRFIQEQYVAL